MLATDWISNIVVAISEFDQHWKELSISKDPRIITALGGKERPDSVINALSYIGQHTESSVEGSSQKQYVLVHDAARPCLTSDDLALIRLEMPTAKAGLLLADKLADTIKLADDSLEVTKTVPREGLWRALTPQVFSLDLLIKALSAAYANSAKQSMMAITDESSAVEAMGLNPLLIQGRSDNIKITKADDLLLASYILKAQTTNATNAKKGMQ